MKQAVLSLAALLALFVAVFLYADPRGQFALNDDFTEAGFAQRTISSGRLRLPQWSCAAAIPQVLIAAAASPFLEPTNQNLRFLNLALAAATLAVLFCLLLRLPLPPEEAACAAALLACNPVFLVMAGSFHSDITCLLFLTLALWAYWESLPAAGAPWLTASSCAAAAALLTRQNAGAAAAGGAFGLWREGRLTGRAAVALLLPALSTGLVFWLWLRFIHGMPWGWASGFQIAALGPSALSPMRLNAPLQTMAGFLAPLALGLAPSVWRLPRPGRKESTAIILVCAAALYAWATHGGMPLMPNTLSRLGLGVAVLNDAAAKQAGLWSAPILWHLLDMICLGSSLVLLRFFTARLALAENWQARVLLWFTVPTFAVMLLRFEQYDRYLLTLIPGGVAAALTLARPREFRWRACLAGCLILAGISALGLKDYYAWNRARWQAGEWAVSRGVPPQAVENGFDWDGQFTCELNMETLLSQKPATAIGQWEWLTLNRTRLATSFSPRPPRADFEPAGRFPYWSALTHREEFVYLYAWKAPK